MKKQYKNILILGLGSTGRSIGEFLKRKKANIYCWDDNKNKLDKIDKNFIKYSNQKINFFDCIYVSPGINKKHKLVKAALLNNISISSDIGIYLDNIKKST